MHRTTIAALAALLTLASTARSADAFCGFYVSGAGGEMFNNATQVVMMRLGTRTVLSMQNNYQGPPEDFAMIVPVPTVLSEDNVKTLEAGVFARVDRMAAPRLVEYWEKDPCEPERVYDRDRVNFAPMADDGETTGAEPEELGVTIEAKFSVAEYQILILSATESTGLDKWLRQENYTIPEGAEPLLRPYVTSGMKFFVAKVDSTKVKFKDGMAMLSPLRVHYDSEEFHLPIRLGLVNSGGTQDLIVHILAPGQRYEVANYGNVTIPTNLDVTDDVRTKFGEFYAALFDKTLEKNPGAVVTEYAWDASTCDPCPEPPLEHQELLTLGADVLTGDAAKPVRYDGSFVLTRLHARYGSDITDDLVFKEAAPIVGGREHRNEKGMLEERSTAGSYNNFQGRYAIRHAWTGPVECSDPIYGRWGGPPDSSIATDGAVPATNLAFVDRGAVDLPMMVTRDVPEIGIVAGAPTKGTGSTGATQPGTATPKTSSKRGCGCASTGAGTAAGMGLFVIVGLALIGRRRRRRG